MKTKKWISLVIGMGWLSQTFAESVDVEPIAQAGFSTTDLLIWLVGFLVLLLMLLVLAQMNLVSRTVHEVRNQVRKQQGLEPLPPPMDLRAFIHKYFTGLKPMDAPENQVQEHEYDGIQELDNRMPPWLTMLFGGTFLFAVIYFSWFVVAGAGPTQHDEYTKEMAELDSIRKVYRASMANAMDENTVEISLDPADLKEGRKIYMDNCASCHGNLGEGGIGPNLTDPYWIHGGGIKDLFRTITYGVPEKGMIAWNDQFMPGEIRNVASFILAELSGTNPPNAKAPQGELWIAPDETSDEINDQPVQNDTLATASLQ